MVKILEQVCVPLDEVLQALPDHFRESGYDQSNEQQDQQHTHERECVQFLKSTSGTMTAGLNVTR
jgi:hypothetical protein